METRDIPGFNRYKITDDGRIYVSNYRRTGKLKQCKYQISHNGYFRICLYKDKLYFKRMVARLVAEVFIPNPQQKPEVNHINCIKTDNRIENLEWVTSSENQLHAVRNRLQKSKINIDIANQIRKLYKSGRYTQVELGKYFGISGKMVSDIVMNKYWKSNILFDHIRIVNKHMSPSWRAKRKIKTGEAIKQIQEALNC